MWHLYESHCERNTACDHWQSGLEGWGNISDFENFCSVFPGVFVCCFVVNWKDYWQFSHCFAKSLSCGPRLSKYLPLVLTLSCNSTLLTAVIQILQQSWTWQMFGQTVGLFSSSDVVRVHPIQILSRVNKLIVPVSHASKLEDEPWRK